MDNIALWNGPQDAHWKPEPDQPGGPSEGTAHEQGETKVVAAVATGSPAADGLHVLCCNGYIKGWTYDYEWAARWAAQLDGRTICPWIKEIRQENNGDQQRA